MKNGRPRKPMALHRLHGTYDASRHRDRVEPVAPGELREPLSWLSAKQKRRFRELLDQAPRHLLREVDASMLAVFVIVEDRIAVANRLQQATPDKPEVGLNVLRTLLPTLRQFASELGFSPAGRAGLRDAAEAELDDDDAARWRQFDRLGHQLLNARIIGPAGEPEEETSDADAAPPGNAIT
jgi:phage terminase small subunit